MPNPYGWGANEPQIKPKDQGGDTIATFSQKIYNAIDNLFDTLNGYPWSTATQSDAGYMSATDKTKLDSVPKIEFGSAGAQSTPAGDVKEFTVTFSQPFSIAPLVYLQLNSGAVPVRYSNLQVTVKTISTTGFTGVVTNLNTVDANPTITWLAIR